MQVTRKSHRWPFVFALGCLLVFCLTVPRFWRSNERATSKKTLDRPRSGATVQRRSRPRDAALDLADLLADEAVVAAKESQPTETTADDKVLFAQLSAGIIPITPVPDPGFSSTTWPTPADVLLANPLEVPTFTIGALPTIEGIDLTERPTIEAQTTTVFEKVGQKVAEFGPQSLVARLARKAIQSLEVTDWPVIAEEPVMSDPVAEATLPLFNVASSSPTPTAANSLWSTPDVLLWQLEELACDPFSGPWATQTLNQLRSLVEGDRRDVGETAALLEGLSDSAASAVKLAEQTSDEVLRVELLRAHWGLHRRLECWTAMRDIRLALVSDARIATRGPLGPLYGEPAANPRLEALSADLEAYERTRDPQIARHVAQLQRQLQSSSSDLDRSLAEAVENNYRNANFRVAITGEMLNRFASQERAESREVNERIAGTPVRGQSETTSRTRVELQPAMGRWQMVLRTDGVVESDTSSVGRAKVFTHGSTQFNAQTPIVVEADGSIRRQSTAVAAENCSQLLGITTGVDWIPLVGGFARHEAANQYQKKRPQAKAEVEYKVESRTMERVDTRADELVADVRQKVKDRLTNPLAKYGVEITTLEMTTTSERLVARLRVAGPEQLAGHTPRPRALSDSLASIQAHESALTNAAVALELNGERLTASQLQARLREKMPRLALEKPPEAPDTTVFQFAAKDAVQCHIREGKFELTLSIAEFREENSRVQNFIVHAMYTPVVNGLSAELVREGALGIEAGQRPIGAADRALLHNVFKIVLAEDRRLPLFRPENPADPRLAGLMITQLVLEDGWLGVSIGPVSSGRVAERQRSLR